MGSLLCRFFLFCFFTIGEFTTSSTSDYDPNRHLSKKDVSVDNHKNPSVVAIKIKCSKTDPFGKRMTLYLGQTLYLGRTSSEICPVSARMEYMAICPQTDGPLFITKQPRSINQSLLCQQSKGDLVKAGIDATHYKGHSFRIGAATTAATCGLSESLIKSLGRWSSSAYMLYIKIPRSELANISPILVGLQSLDSGQTSYHS